MNNQLCIVTGNNSKFKRMRNFIEHYAPEISTEQISIDLPEIQSLDLKKVAINKAKSAYNQVQKSLVIDDGGFFLEAYNNFPGALSKFVNEGIGIDGLFKLAEHNCNGLFRNYLVYIDGPNSYQLFEGISKGKLVRPEKYDFNEQLPYSAFFLPDGSDKTYAELEKTPQEHQFNHRSKALKLLIASLQAK